jgi:hypothetical protein
MPTDFDQEVLVACEDTFARPIMIDPIRSQPGKVPFTARAIFTSRNANVVLADGSVLSDQTTMVGVRLADENYDGSPMFVKAPMKRDRVYIPDLAGTQYWVRDTTLDGQGGMTLHLGKEYPTT